MIINIYLICFFFTILILIRNDEVFHYRKKVIDFVYSGSKWEEKAKVLDKIPYERMVFQFWKPVEKFFPEDWKII